MNPDSDLGIIDRIIGHKLSAQEQQLFYGGICILVLLCVCIYFFSGSSYSGQNESAPLGAPITTSPATHTQR